MVRVQQEVEDDLGVHRMDPGAVGSLLQREGAGHPFPVGYRAGDGYGPHAGEVGREGNTGGVPAGPAPGRIGGRAAPGLWNAIVSSGAEPARVEGGTVPPDVGVVGGQLVDTQGQCVVWTGRGVIAEPGLGPSDGTRPGLECPQLLPEPCWAPALMHHQVLRGYGLVF